MKKLKLLIFITLLWNSATGQFLHFGVGVSAPNYVDMGFYRSDDLTELVYYFPNQQNETIRFSWNWETGWSDSWVYIPYPEIYARYNFNNRFYIQADISGMWFSNRIKYINSVDFTTYVREFFPEGTSINTGYNSVDIDWYFMSNSITAGWAFLQTKAFRPYIDAGITARYLMYYGPGDTYWETWEGRQIRNEIILSNQDTFRMFTLYAKLGAGIKYHGVSIGFYYDTNITPVDVNSDYLYWAAENSDYTSFDKVPNYEYLDTYKLTLSVNLLSFNTQKSKINE